MRELPTPPKSLDRLPNWAQEHIARLERAAAEAHAEAEEARAALSGDGTSPFSIEWRGVGQRLPLPKSASRILWTPPNRDLGELLLTEENGRLMVLGRGHGSLMVRPQSSNVVTVSQDSGR